MPHDMVSTTTWSQVQPPTGPLVTPTVYKPEVRRDADAMRTDVDGRSDDLSISDGVRILDDLAPLERARLYQHSQPSRLEVLNAWEGAVTAVDHQARTFTARLYDLTYDTADISEADFDINDVSANDIELLRVGGVFRWMIGYRKHSFGQHDRISTIKFRRLPAWSADDIEAAKAEGERLAGKIRLK
jgi:hypothetical protein